MNLDINDLDELSDLLGKAYCIEVQMEGATEWEAYLKVKPKYRDLIYRLSHESATHRKMLKDMAKNLKDLDIEKASEKDHNMNFNFKNKMDEEVLTEIIKYDRLAVDLYSRLHEHTCKDFIAKVWSGKDPSDYFSTLKELISQEEGHVKALSQFTGSSERII